MIGPFAGPPRRAPARPLPRAIVLACGLSAVLLAGCAGLAPAPGAAPAEPIAVPTAWAGADNAPAPAGASPLLAWWQRFDDPLLAQLVQQALQANTSVRSATAALRQARALQDAAGAALGPSLNGSASAQRSYSNQNASNRLATSLDASWELDLFGKQRSALQASTASAEASAASLGDVQVSIAAEVALAYIGLRSAQVRLVIAEDNLASQQQTLQITRWREQAGLVTALDVQQALAAAESTRAGLLPLQTSIAQSRHALAVLGGQPPAALDSALASAGAVPQPADDLALSGPADTLRQRPDVRAAERRLAAEVARLAQAEAARRPSFNLSGSLGLSALTLGALGNGASVLGSLLAGVSLPLYDGGALRAQVRAQQATLDQAAETWRASVLTALQEVEDALVALRNNRERGQRLQAAAQAAGNAAALARQRYASGLVDFQAVLETQRSQLNAQDSLASNRADVSADHVRLYKALGGGWRDEAPGDATAAATANRTPTP